jgi:hypothetical protein
MEGGHCSCGSTCQRPAKHPLTPHGLKDASLAPGLIARWWRQWPRANVAIATGAASGLVVLDVDPGKDGDASLRALEAERGELPETVQVLTGGGGQHFFFAHPGGQVRNSASTLGAGLDVRADGGYVVAAPSLHASGKRYTWEVSGRPDEVAPAPLPGWLLEALRAPAAPTLQAPRPGQHWLKVLRDGAGEGRRNATCASLAGYLFRIRSLHPEVAAEVVRLWASTRCQPPLPEDEVQKTLHSVARTELARRQRQEKPHV